MFLDKEAVRLEVLAERIRQMLVNATDKQVFLRSDGDTVQELMDVIDGSRPAGSRRSALSTKLPVSDERPAVRCAIVISPVARALADDVVLVGPGAHTWSRSSCSPVARRQRAGVREVMTISCRDLRAPHGRDDADRRSSRPSAAAAANPSRPRHRREAPPKMTLPRTPSRSRRRERAALPEAEDAPQRPATGNR